jgi:hypothetical protein
MCLLWRPCPEAGYTISLSKACTSGWQSLSKHHTWRRGSVACSGSFSTVYQRIPWQVPINSKCRPQILYDKYRSTANADDKSSPKWQASFLNVPVLTISDCLPRWRREWEWISTRVDIQGGEAVKANKQGGGDKGGGGPRDWPSWAQILETFWWRCWAPAVDGGKENGDICGDGATREGWCQWAVDRRNYQGRWIESVQLESVHLTRHAMPALQKDPWQRPADGSQAIKPRELVAPYGYVQW